MATFDLSTPEAWYPTPGFDGYEVSSHFRVRCWLVQGSRSRRRAAEPRLIKWQRHGPKRYFRVIVRLPDGRHTSLYLHRTVAELAHGPCPDGLFVLHRDDDTSNNSPGNLYYGTHDDNVRDQYANGRTRRAKGAENTNAILSDDAVRSIRSAWDARAKRYGERKRLAAELAVRFGITPRTVEGIGERRRWAHVV